MYCIYIYDMLQAQFTQAGRLTYAKVIESKGRLCTPYSPVCLFRLLTTLHNLLNAVCAVYFEMKVNFLNVFINSLMKFCLSCTMGVLFTLKRYLNIYTLCNKTLHILMFSIYPICSVFSIYIFYKFSWYQIGYILSIKDIYISSVINIATGYNK